MILAWAALGVYWLLSGVALWLLPSPSDTGLSYYLKSPFYVVLELVVCLLFGGILVPARLIAKAIR